MLPLLLAVAVLQDSQAARAESLLAVGRAHFARPVIGRYAALAAFRAAARVAPADPEPLYWQMKVGFYLGSDEGDVLARDAIVRILTLRPDYEDVWERFQTIYRNPAVWRRADHALARHPDDVIAMERRAEVAIALERPLVADSLLAEVLRRRAPYVPAYLLRAEASFDAGRDAAGYAWYDSAVVYADLDSTGAMWDAVWMIASPAEVAAQDSTEPGDRRRFFERFWAKRDPNLVTPGNERIAEHFRRLAYARRYFRLLHPMNLYQRSLRYRAIIAATQRDFLAARGRQQVDPYPGAETDRLLATSRQLPDLASGEATASALAGLDARGLIYIRHGRPDELLHGYFDPLSPVGAPQSPLDVEGWLYHTSQGTLSIGFRRASGSTMAELAGGDFIFLPTTRRQAYSTRAALQTDRTTLPAPLEARAWSAFFKSGELGLTDVYLKTEGDSAAAVLWDATDAAVRARGRGDELLEISVPPGRYDLGFDVTANGVLGRTRRQMAVPRFSLVDLGLSSLALAPGADLLDRDAVLAGMPARLVFPAGTPLSAYVEVYGLTPDRDGRSHYHVRYTFAPLRWSGLRLFGGARPVVFEFDRDVRGSGGPERLVITPDQLPPGRYRVTVGVTDLLRNVKSEAAALEVTIR